MEARDLLKTRTYWPRRKTPVTLSGGSGLVHAHLDQRSSLVGWLLCSSGLRTGLQDPERPGSPPELRVGPVFSGLAGAGGCPLPPAFCLFCPMVS